MLIKNGFVVSSVETKLTDILIEEGKIKHIGPVIEYEGEIIDAKGMYVFPGAIDVHTHFDLDVGIAVSTDDFYTGTVAAAIGGTTSIVDHMGFGPGGCNLNHQLDVYHKKAAGNAVIDYSFHGVIQHINDDILNELEDIKNKGLSSVKFYMTYDYMLDDYNIFKLLKKAKELDLMITFHPENDGIIKNLKADFKSQRLLTAEYHPKSRPPECEAEAISRVLKMAKIIEDVNIYVVHLSSFAALQEVRRARMDGYEKVFVETCPQYLLLDDSLYSNDDGLKYIMSPPLRNKVNNAQIWNGITCDEIQTIGTDHCPFNYNIEKQQGKADFTACPNGAPGVELRPILIFSEGFMKEKIDLQQYVKLISTNPAKLFGLKNKGDIREEYDADLFIVNPNYTQTIEHKNLHENVDYTPYEGISVKGKVVYTLSNGEIIARDNEFIGKKGRGKFIKRGTMEDTL